MGNTSSVMHSDTSSRKFPAVPRSSDTMLQAVFSVIKPTVLLFLVTAVVSCWVIPGTIREI